MRRTRGTTTLTTEDEDKDEDEDEDGDETTTTKGVEATTTKMPELAAVTIIMVSTTYKAIAEVAVDVAEEGATSLMWNAMYVTNMGIIQMSVGTKTMITRPIVFKKKKMKAMLS